MLIKNCIESNIEQVTFPSIPTQNAATFLSVLYQLEESQKLDGNLLTSIQMKQLQRVFSHAINHVPYYQNLFRSQGIKKIPETITADFISLLPLLTRSLTQSAEKQLLSSSVPESHGKVSNIQSSGSTGTPVTVSITELAQTYWKIFTLRNHLWQKRDFTKTLTAIRRAPKHIGMAPHGLTRKNWGSAASSVFKTGKGYFLNIASSLADQVSWLEKVQPDYLITFPSNLMALVDFTIENQIQINSLIDITTVGETVTEKLREKVFSTWGVPIKDIYSCEEAGYIAIQCPENDHYHVQSENVYVEIINEKGNPCQIGEVGNLLITTINNFATPLIRYELGDMAEWGEPCSCGINLPVIKKIHGRKRNRLTMPDGASEFPYLGEYEEFMALTTKMPRQFQFIQKSTQLIEFKLAIDEPLNTQEEESFTRLIQKNFNHPFDVIFSYHENIPKSANGKFEEFLSEIS